MPVPLMPVFDTYPEEAKLIGRMLAGFGELELQVCMCLGVALGDTDQAIRACYRAGARIRIADALMRKSFAEVGLAGDYDAMIGAVRYCSKLRNTYAHCHWGNGRGLCYRNLENEAENQVITAIWYFVDLMLLQKQEAYFAYTRQLLLYLEFALAKVRGKRVPRIARPADLLVPPTFSCKAEASAGG